MSIWRKEANEKRKRILWRIRRKMYERKRNMENEKKKFIKRKGKNGKRAKG